MRRNDDALSGLGPPGDRHSGVCRLKHSQDWEPDRFSTIRETVRANVPTVSVPRLGYDPRRARCCRSAAPGDVVRFELTAGLTALACGDLLLPGGCVATYGPIRRCDLTLSYFTWNSISPGMVFHLAHGISHFRAEAAADMRAVGSASSRSAYACAFCGTVGRVGCPPRPLRNALKARLRTSHWARELAISARVLVIWKSGIG
jgi:hypothetical protein